MFNANPETKAGILALVLICCVFMLGDWLGLIADKDVMQLQERRETAQMLASEITKDIESGNLDRVQTTLDSFIERNKQVDSITFSSSALTALSQIVAEREGIDSSLERAVQIVPIYSNAERFGALELSFDTSKLSGIVAASNYSVVVLMFLFTAGGFLFHRAFLGRSMDEQVMGGIVPVRIKEAFDSLAEGVLVLDDTGRIAHANRAFKESCCMQSYMLAGTWLHDLNWANYIDGEPVAENMLPWLRVLKSGEEILGEKLTLRTGEGIERSYGVNCTPLHDSDDEYRGVIVTLDNLTELERRNATLKKSLSELEETNQSIDVKNRELELLATRDPLTNCLNRRAFTERFNTIHHEASQSGSPLVCMMIDIDHFKRINDNYGHALGDKVIKFVARVLEKQIRQEDLLGRYGGEEFCVVLENTTLEDAAAVAERMRKEIAAGDPSLFGSALRTTASFGVVSLSSEPVESDELIHRADKALYLAKESGRNKVMTWEYSNTNAQTEPAPGQRVECSEDKDSTVVRHFFGDASVTEREWQLEETADAFKGQLNEISLSVSRQIFCEKSLFVDRVNQALLLAGRESRSMAVMSMGVSIERLDSMPLEAALIDKALKTTVRKLREKLRTSDVIVVFPDVTSITSLPVVVDEEIGVLLPEVCDAESAGWVAQRIQSILHEPLCVDDQNLSISCHLGVSVFPNDARDGVSLVQAACVSRFFSQEHGEEGGIEFYSGHLNSRFKEVVQLQKELAVAVESDQFELLYQPKVDVQSGQIVGFESLLRWNHPRRGLLTPNEFLGIAEKTRLINMIGDWVLRQSCREIVKMSDACSRELTCAVNMSVVQLAQPDLVEQVMCALSEEGLEPHRLELELTEDALQGGLDTRFAQLTQLQAQGVSIAIDDFSAGCSGLNYLRNLPVDILKIDRYFVADLVDNEHDSAIITAIMTMAEALNLRVIAEGVESQAQFEALGELACTEAQGYFFGRPIPAKEALSSLVDSAQIAHVG
ncbi:MAG: EAL domain-containing protein [Halioglobus sp.]